MLTADQAVWDESLNLSLADKPFIEKDIIYIQDQNNSYSGQIQFDCSSLANNSRYLSYKEAYFEFPIVITAKSDSDTQGPLINAFSIAIKNGYYQFIDQIQVDLNNQNVVQLQNNLNTLVNYKLLTSMSQEDLIKYGHVLGFYPDSADSYKYSAGPTGSADGIGYSNNRNGTDGTDKAVRAVTNAGLLPRQKMTVGNDTAFGTTLPTTVDAAEAAKLFKQEGRNYYTKTGTDKDTKHTWIIVATIRLKDICDFFDKLPISKGLNLRFTINYNSFRATIAGTAGAFAISNYTQLSGHTCPIMFASGSAGSTNDGVNIAGNIEINCNIGSTSDGAGGNVANSIISNTRLYVPAYKLDPDYEATLLRTMPISKIRYYDYYTYTVNEVEAGGTFNQILSNGILNPKAIIVVPFVKTTGALTLSQLQSPFDSAPGTTAPEVSIINFQILLAGSNVFKLSQQYTFSQFLDEFSSLFALNGGKNTGLTSGLIGKYEWEHAYRYYVCDLSRRVKFEDNIPKSVQISGTNNSGASVTYMTFILFERGLNIKTSTGEIVV